MHRHATITWKCPGCGACIKVPRLVAPIRCYCGFTQLQHPPGIGDRVAAGLCHLGLTRRRYEAARAALGLKKPCKCPERQHALNELGNHLANLAAYTRDLLQGLDDRTEAASRDDNHDAERDQT